MMERYIAAADLGSSKIALTVAKITGEDIEILYYKEKPSKGIRNSAIFNPQHASSSLKEAIEEAENELKVQILQVVVNLPRCGVHQEVAEASVVRSNPDSSITEEEVESLKNLAKDKYPLEDAEQEELYAAIPQSFSSDEGFQLIESDIIGVISSKFSGNFKLLIGKKSAVRNIDNVFINNLRIAVAKEYFSPAVISKAILTEDEMENGVALIDFGAGATSVTIYQGKILRHYASIPFGGATITSDIRSECSISEKLAENLKLAYGVCLPDRLQSLEDKILQIMDTDIDRYKQIPVKFLSELVTARALEIIQAILYEIQKSGYMHKLRNGIVITGGGANLANLTTLIREESGYSVRLGTPRHLFSTSGCEGIMSTSATNSLGMILAAKNDNIMDCIEMTCSAEYNPVEYETYSQETAAVGADYNTEPAYNTEYQEEAPTYADTVTSENEPEIGYETVSEPVEDPVEELVTQEEKPKEEEQKEEEPKISFREKLRIEREEAFKKKKEERERKEQEKAAEAERKRKEREEKGEGFTFNVVWTKLQKAFTDVYENIDKEEI